MSASDQLAETVRAEGARLLATLVRTVGDWSVAEEAVQEAAIAALRDWPVRGIPDQPRAWLTTTARRKAIDIIRRERSRSGKEHAGAELAELTRADGPPPSVVDDDLLRLIFTCCHPSLPPEAQLTLALRTLAQLPIAQIAAVLLTREAAISKRLTRTRHKISSAQIAYRVPTDGELPARLAVACGVVHAIYTTGHSPAGAAAAVDGGLCHEGLRLARLLHELLPDETLPAALLALILFTESRRLARTDADGDLVLLADQDRSRWDQIMIVEGCQLLDETLRRTQGVADPYQVQAAIARAHARAVTYAETDWPEIVRLYELLLSVAPSAPAALGQAVAVAERDGPEAGLRLLAALPPDPRVEGVRSELLGRTGRWAAAAAAADRALTGSVLTAPERQHLASRRDRWRAAGGRLDG